MVPRLIDHFRLLRLDSRRHGDSDRAVGEFQLASYVADAVAEWEKAAGRTVEQLVPLVADIPYAAGGTMGDLPLDGHADPRAPETPTPDALTRRSPSAKSAVTDRRLEDILRTALERHIGHGPRHSTPESYGTSGGTQCAGSERPTRLAA